MADDTNTQDTAEAAPDLAITLIERLLDWPFLLFVLVAGIFFFARSEFFALLSTRQIEVEVGGQKLKIGEAVEKLDQETDVTREDLDALQAQIDALRPQAAPQADGGASDDDDEGDVSLENAADLTDSAAVGRMREALRNSSYKWRSIERLALKAGVSEDRAHALLAGQSDIKLSIGKSERKIARLRKSN